MSLRVESVEQNSIGIKVEGDLGDVQIIEESSDSEDTQIEPENINTVANFPNNLLQSGTTPVFGTVAVTNSENVQFGNNTFFNGPVTIKQVIQTSSGVDNASYIKTDNENLNQKDSSQKEPISKGKFKIKTWHKLSFSAMGLIVLGSVCAGILVTPHTHMEHNSNYASDEEGGNHILVTGVYSENVKLVILSAFFVLVTLLLWVFCSTLAEATYCDREQENDILKCCSQYTERYEADSLLIAPGHLRIVSRTDWLAQPVEEKIDQIRQPVPWVIITHTATEGCFTQSSCVLRVRLMQTFHIESKGWSDIAYNFMVGGDGSAYHGRGWDQVAAHTKGYNKYSIAIAFIGTFNTESPTKNQVEACKNLIKLGVAEGKLAKDYKLFAHRQLMSTLSPGDKVYEIIKTWPHFVTETDISTLVPNY